MFWFWFWFILYTVYLLSGFDDVFLKNLITKRFELYKSGLQNMFKVITASNKYIKYLINGDLRLYDFFNGFNFYKTEKTENCKTYTPFKTELKERRSLK